MTAGKNWLDEPVFILSIGKTGTTLLIALFDGHEEMTVIPEETDYFSAVHIPIKMICANPLISKSRKVDKIFDLMVHGTHLHVLNGHKREKSFAKDNYDYTAFDFSTFSVEVKKYLNESDLSLSSILKSVPRALAISQSLDQSKLRMWLEKTPYHIFNVENKIPALEHAFPKAKFIHIYRNPIDNFIAFRKKDSDKWSEDKFIYDLKRNVKLTKDHINKDNHYLIRYEDIVLKTESTLKSLTSFLEIEFTENMLRPTKSGSAWEGNSVENSQFKGISSTSLDKHLKYDNKDQLRYLEHYLQDEIDYLGYKVSYLTPGGNHNGYDGYPEKRKKQDARQELKHRLYYLVTKASL